MVLALRSADLGGEWVMLQCADNKERATISNRLIRQVQLMCPKSNQGRNRSLEAGPPWCDRARSHVLPRLLHEACLRMPLLSEPSPVIIYHDDWRPQTQRTFLSKGKLTLSGFQRTHCFF